MQHGTKRPAASCRSACSWLSGLSVSRHPPSARKPQPPSETLAAPLSTRGRPAGRAGRRSTPKDCAELAETTVTYGQRVKSAQQPSPKGVVRDALAAVDLGEKTDAKAADWPQPAQGTGGAAAKE